MYTELCMVSLHDPVRRAPAENETRLLAAKDNDPSVSHRALPYGLGCACAGQADMRGWVRSTLMPRLPRSLLTWSGVWATVIKPVLHHNIMLRNRVSAPFTQGPAAMLLQQPVRNVACCLMHLLFIDMLQLLSLMHLT